MTISITPLMHNTIADSVFGDILSKSSKYYYFLGKTVPYVNVGGGIEQVETPLPTYSYELSSRRDILTFKEITVNDVSFVVPRINWTTGTVYDHYDDTYTESNPAFSGATSVTLALFYVLTDEFNIYICLDNNKNSMSTVKPTGYDTTPFVTADGYKWKCVMNIPLALRVKFLTSFYMPVVNTINSFFYNNGAIDTISIDNPGSGYPANTTASITVNSATASVSSLVVGRTYAIASLGVGTNWSAIDDTLPITNYIGNATTTVTGTVPTTSLTITNYICNATTTVTGTVSSTANFFVGDKVIISGATGTEQTKLNGTWTITSIPSSTTFTFVVSTAVTTGTLTTNLGTTVKTKSSMYKSGDTIVISGATGTEQTKLNGTWTIVSAPTSTTFTFVVSTAVTTGTLTTNLGNTVKTKSILDITNYTGIGTTTVTGTVSSTADFFVGDSIVISSATGTEQTKLNGTWTIASIPSSTTFTFVVSTAVTTGTLTTNLGTTVKTKVYSVGYVFNSSVTSGSGTGTVKGTGAVLTPRVSSVDGQIVRVDVVSGGSGYPAGTTLAVVGSGTGKFSPNTTALLTPIMVNGVISYATIVDPGINYNANNTTLAVQSDSGVDARLTAIITSGQITDVIIDNPGTGYKSANVTAFGTGGSGAKFTVSTSGGNLDTVQANVELLAVDGAIDYIHIDNPGEGYTGINVSIDGDGQNATATASVVDGRLNKITITNRGSGYRYATVTLTALVTVPTILASVRAVLPPYLGHGKNAITNLFSNTLMLYSTIDKENTSGFSFNNDYRQYGIIKNPTQYDSSLFYSDKTGTTCFIVEGTLVNGPLIEDRNLTDILGHNYTVVAVTVLTVSTSKVLLQSNDNSVPEVGQILSNGLTTYTLTSVINPDIDKYSGDMLYIDNRAAFYQTEDQSVTLQTVLRF